MPITTVKTLLDSPITSKVAFTPMLEVSTFLSFNIAVILLILGKLLTLRFEVLRRYSIPEPVVGGFLCVTVTGLVWGLADTQINFQLGMRDYLLLLFFAGIGLKSDVRTLLAGGKPLLVLLILASSFILLQNLTGMGMASLFGLDPKAGLMVGSISLTGGVGTTLAWAPIFIKEHGISNAMELGIAANTVGLIAACIIGGPIARYLIQRHAMQPSTEKPLDVGISNTKPLVKVDYISVLWAILTLNLTVVLGTALHSVIVASGINLPAFVGCLVAGILLNNLLPRKAAEKIRTTWPGTDEALGLISDLSLGLFLIMALMSLQLWELSGVLTFIMSTLTVQIALAVLFILFVVFPLMGHNYEATVISAGFGGITLGSTATAIANMTAVSQQYGAAHRAFVIVPLVCGFFIDLVNAFIIWLLLL